MRRRGGVVCETAVELGGSRSSEGEKKVEAGTKIKVKGSLKVYHVPKNPELDIDGLEGEVKEVVTTFKGKPVSATFPYKVQLVTKGEESRKFFVHLKDDEFVVLD
jgi:WD repeat-containing protein 35